MSLRVVGKGLGALLLVLVLIGIACWLLFGKQVQFPDETGETGQQQDSMGKLGVGMTIKYADGTVKTVDPSSIYYTLFPLKVYLQGEPITEITWHCYVQLDWIGEITSLELNGPMEVKSNTGITLRKEGMYRIYTPNTLPAKNKWFELWKFTLTAGDIEYSLGSGDYTLTCTVGVTAKALFSGGVESVKSASASGNLPITIQTGQLMSLLCDVQAQAFK